jgi:hypothetical protein
MKTRSRGLVQFEMSSVNQPIRLDLLQDGGRDFFDGFGGRGQPANA